MPHRRRNRRFEFPPQLSAEESGFLLRSLNAPRWLAPRLNRAKTPAQWRALLHPARWAGRPLPSEV